MRLLSYPIAQLPNRFVILHIERQYIACISLPCSVQNVKTIRQLKWMLWANEFSGYLICGWISCIAPPWSVFDNNCRHSYQGISLYLYFLTQWLSLSTTYTCPSLVTANPRAWRSWSSLLSMMHTGVPSYLKTWIRLLLESATRIFSPSVATPNGSFSCPFSFPKEPKLYLADPCGRSGQLHPAQ